MLPINIQGILSGIKYCHWLKTFFLLLKKICCTTSIEFLKLNKFIRQVCNKSLPKTTSYYEFKRRTKTKTKEGCSSEKKCDDDEAERRIEKNEFETSFLFFIVDHCSQVARLAVLVYACDCVVIALEAVGYQVQYASKVFAKILYTR